MPRKYTPKGNKQYKKYDDQLIELALTAYNTTEASLTEISNLYNVPRTVLQRHNTVVMKKQGGQRALSPEMEEYLIKYINVCSEWGYPLEKFVLRSLMKDYLDRLGYVSKRFVDNLPGPDFIDSFLKRYKDKISPKLKKNIKRARAAVGPKVIHSYFDELEASLQGVPLCNIVNFDETNLSDDPIKKKVLVKRHSKYPERDVTQGKASTSLMMAAAADGALLPPYVVYKGQDIYDTWRLNGPCGCRYNRTASGWFNSLTFEDWVNTIILPYFKDKTGTKILIGDSFSTHLTIDLIRDCLKNDIIFICLPTKSIHFTQPLDVAFFRSLKVHWRDILYNWKRTDGRIYATIPNNTFPTLLNKLLDQIECKYPHNVLAGFENCGISPLNKDKILEKLPGNTERHDHEEVGIDQAILSILQENICIKEQIQPLITKKLYLPPGKSVGGEEKIEITEEYNIKEMACEDSNDSVVGVEDETIEMETIDEYNIEGMTSEDSNDKVYLLICLNK